jgi:hypothetical protein
MQPKAIYERTEEKVGAIHPFDKATGLQGPVDSQRGATSDAYWGTVAPFGGTTSGTMLRAVRRTQIG